MCGIAGAWGLAADERAATLRIALARIEHRGRPGTLYETADAPEHACVLGTQRLPIVAPEAGRQPVASPAGRYLVVFNGEVFNHTELLDALRGDGGAPAEGLSDTAVLAAALERWGPHRAVELFEWEGAFLALETATGRMFAARDHLGIKPLYWTRVGGGLAWASEIKALVRLPGSAPVAPVPPGTVLHWDAPDQAEPVVSPWWRIQDAAAAHRPAPTEPEQVDQLEELVRDAVRSRVPPRGRYAVALSGGLDSSLVLRLALETNDAAVAYVLSRPGSEDLPRAVELCRELGVPCVPVPAPDPDELRGSVRSTVRIVESWEWQVLNHAAPMAALMRAIRADDHKVVLTGEGADELFMGYIDPASEHDASVLEKERFVRTADLHRTNCRRVDRMGMAEGLECRVPLLSRRITEFALALPAGSLVSGGHTKWPLRQTALRVLPRRYALRSKLSFARGAGYRYRPGPEAGVFGLLEAPAPAAPRPPEWDCLARYPAESAFLDVFLALGYGRAAYLRARSR